MTGSIRIVRSRPPAVPATDERQAWAVLASVDGLGPAGFHALLRAHGTASAILEASERPGATRDFAAIIGEEDGRRPAPGEIADAIRAAARGAPALGRVLEAANVEIVTLDDERYPVRLR